MTDRTGDITGGVREILFPRKGISSTELLLAVNLVVAAVLVIAWGPEYRNSLYEHAVGWWHAVRENGAYGWFAPTLFLHVGLGHLASNMIALVAAAGAAEFLVGGRWTLAAYLITGLAGAWVSYAGHQAPPLSVGASGAIFGLLGCTASLIIRRRSLFNYAQRWKVWRVYVPLFLLLFVPSIVRADLWGHAGGFASGLLLGLWLPPHPRVRYLGAIDPLAEEEPDPPEEAEEE